MTARFCTSARSCSRRFWLNTCRMIRPTAVQSSAAMAAYEAASCHWRLRSARRGARSMCISMRASGRQHGTRSWRELVADAAYGHDMDRIVGPVLDLLAQVADMDVDRFLVADEVLVVPYLA